MSQHSGEIKEDEVSAALAYDETPSDPPYEPPDDEYLRQELSNCGNAVA